MRAIRKLLMGTVIFLIFESTAFCDCPKGSQVSIFRQNPEFYRAINKNKSEDQKKASRGVSYIISNESQNHDVKNQAAQEDEDNWRRIIEVLDL